MTKTKETRTTYESLTESALQALIELENLRRNRHHPCDETKKLFSTLRKAPGFGVESEELINRASPIALAAYTQALRQSHVHEVKTFSDLTKNILKLADSVRSDVANLSDADLERLGDFCAALHREMLAETMSSEVEDRESRQRETTLGLR